MRKSSINDSVRILRMLSFQRAWNIIRLKWSFQWSKWFNKAWHSGNPFAVSIEPTTACNLGCPACPSGLKAFTRPTGKLDLEQHEQWLEQLKKHTFYINYYFQGEPFLHPQFLDLIRAAKKHRIYTATSTNAHFIDAKKALEIVDSGLDRLIISIDGLTQETYSSYRVHGQLDKVIAASKHLVAAKRERKQQTPFLIFQFLVVKANEHEIDTLHELAHEIGIDEIRFKSAQVYDYENGNELIPDNERYSRYYKKKDGTYRVKFKGGDHCWRMWSSAVLTWDGQVVPCCFDKDAQHTLGTLQTESFSTIWNNDRYRDFRTSVLQDRNAIEICTNCSEGAKVWVD
ncbi:MAG: radical SAM/SPASM domain-containing protein [Fluviicola sp.]|nr:radical SAM/SPASM domain-containing protein [Fluviicola sp.]